MAQLSDDCFAFGGPMMSVDEAVGIIASRVLPVSDIEMLPITQADGRILAHDIAAPLPLPPFTNSAVDGYAVRSADLPQDEAKAFPVSGRVQAGALAGETIQSGQAGNAMMGGLTQLGIERATAEFGDWTTRIANGELPAEAPPRPQGIERNVVITQWDWADPKAYLHDEIASDKRNPRVNANGLIFGSPEESRDYLPVLDPVRNTTDRVTIPYREPNTPGQPKPLQPSTFFGDEAMPMSEALKSEDMGLRVHVSAQIIDLADLRARIEASKSPRGGVISLAGDLAGEGEIEFRLPQRYSLDANLRGQLKAAPGVLYFEDV